MSAPPKTVLTATPDEEAAIRDAVRRAEGRTVAGPEHVAGLQALLADPAVSDPIYDLPRPITFDNVALWVADSEALRQEGRCILSVSFDEAGAVGGYSRITVWPERASGELAGARRADLQNSGQGARGVAQSIAWMFEVLGLRLIGLTAAVDNIRSAKAIDAAGFKRMGEVESVRPDGATRRSLYWELTRSDWELRHRL
ncbi:MAG TPA: GNAT family protein [Phenylobacterium sp.]|jgi:RimJ/RimL family protein N-acetyltransferase|uniref:GNAT family N-acetyltransferase n=1 Tax=Phenylobacterium sp. TaxID=1871053 RepID=UPI002D610687|nr:GNAT family protein [Phenylobacterium sp.]HZZ70039.1 GNAT family protein [Phenylobacterium sp.]